MKGIFNSTFVCELVLFSRSILLIAVSRIKFGNNSEVRGLMTLRPKRGCSGEGGMRLYRDILLPLAKIGRQITDIDQKPSGERTEPQWPR